MTTPTVTAINTNTLCIPRVFPNIKESRIRSVINELHMCEIDKIDMVQKTGEKGDKFNRVFIHIKEWYQNNTNAKAAQERLKEGKDIKIIYDDPWFWKVSAYRKNQYTNNNNQKNQKTPYHKKAHMVIENDKNKTKTDAEIDMLIEDMMNAALTNSPITNILQNQKTNIEKKEVVRRIKNVRKNPPKLSVLNPDDIPNE